MFGERKQERGKLIVETQSKTFAIQDYRITEGKARVHGKYHHD